MRILSASDLASPLLPKKEEKDKRPFANFEKTSGYEFFFFGSAVIESSRAVLFREKN